MRNHIFGPVPSRRLGFSLGIDLTPDNACSFNCLYCQLTVTQTVTCKRQSFCSKDAVFKELEQVLKEINTPDWLTLSGSGEPTLSSDLGSFLEQVKNCIEVPCCVITNSSLIWRQDVQQELLFADSVLPTITTTDQKTFETLHQPTREICVTKILEGLYSFSKIYKGLFEPELFICPGFNDSEEEIRAISDFLKSLPTLSSVYINTAVRIPVSKKIITASQKKLDSIRNMLDLPVPVTTAFERNTPIRVIRKRPADESDLLRLLLRHPCTYSQLMQTLDMGHQNLDKLLNRLKSQIKCNSDGSWSVRKQSLGTQKK